MERLIRSYKRRLSAPLVMVHHCGVMHFDIQSRKEATHRATKVPKNPRMNHPPFIHIGKACRHALYAKPNLPSNQLALAPLWSPAGAFEAEFFAFLCTRISFEEAPHLEVFALLWNNLDHRARDAEADCRGLRFVAAAVHVRSDSVRGAE